MRWLGILGRVLLVSIGISTSATVLTNVLADSSNFREFDERTVIFQISEIISLLTSSLKES